MANISSIQHTKRAFLLDSIVVSAHFVGLLSFFSYDYCSFFTVKANGQFKFMPLHSSKDTHVIETVKYQCPPFMGGFCQREVEFQRRAILDNLKVYFEQK